MLRLDHITHCYDAKPQLFAPLTLQMGSNETLLLLGDNGVGKTTLLRIIAGLLRPSHGQVKWQSPPRLGVVMDRSYLYTRMSGLDNLRLYARFYRNAKQQLDWAAKTWGLHAFWEQAVGTLSRGQMQRLSLARATFHMPDALILDEPQTALDAEGVGLMQTYLSEFKRDGGMSVIASHEPALFRAEIPKELHLYRHGERVP